MNRTSHFKSQDFIWGAQYYRYPTPFPEYCEKDIALRASAVFTREVFEKFKNHKALYMWDVWNEPEQCTPFRNPIPENLVCRCKYCESKFGGMSKNPTCKWLICNILRYYDI